MKKLPISMFDLGIIIAFVVIGLIGAGGWYYFSGQLADAQADVRAADEQFEKFSSVQSASEKILVSHGNQKTLQGNIDLIKSQLTPLIQGKLMPKENKLYSIEKVDPVTWKHNLDDKVRELTAAAGTHGVKLPTNFYFTFANYLNANPNEDQTEVLSKQMLAIDQLSNILINAPVQSIIDLQRTYEEESKGGGGGSGAPTGSAAGGKLGGYSYLSEGGAYRVYPFAFEVETTTTGFRTIMNELIKSPYIFVVRAVTVQNTHPASPHPADLDKMAGSNDVNVTLADPGHVAATVSTKGPQYLFGNSTLQVKVRVDLIEWLAPAPVATDKVDTSTPAAN
jgi:hypothetical protein